MNNKLEFINVTKKYKDKLALDSFTATLTKGVYGLLGPNGAGKSTLINLLTDSVTRTSGTIQYNDTEILELGTRFREKIGYMPQQQGMYDNFSAERFLYYMASLKGMKRKEANMQISKYLDMTGLTNDAHRKLGGFSGGMRQRVLFASALLANPEILILDEPTAGLDPEERIKIRNYISELAEDKIVILATHVVADIECIASEVILLNHGKLLNMLSPHELITSVEDKIYEKRCNYKELLELQKIFKKGNVSQRRDGFAFRIVQDECPKDFEHTDSVANLEDAYLYFFS